MILRAAIASAGTVLVVVASIGALIALLALSGAMFRLWPTSWPDSALVVTPKQLDDLNALLVERKFVPDPLTHYPGATSEASRLLLERIVNDLISTATRSLPIDARKSTFLAELKLALAATPQPDTEDMERLGGYVERIMDILGIDSSNELLDVWRFGIPIGLFSRRSPN